MLKNTAFHVTSDCFAIAIALSHAIRTISCAGNAPTQKQSYASAATFPTEARNANTSHAPSVCASFAIDSFAEAAQDSISTTDLIPSHQKTTMVTIVHV